MSRNSATGSTLTNDLMTRMGARLVSGEPLKSELSNKLKLNLQADYRGKSNLSLSLRSKSVSQAQKTAADSSVKPVDSNDETVAGLQVMPS